MKTCAFAYVHHLLCEVLLNTVYLKSTLAADLGLTVSKLNQILLGHEPCSPNEPWVIRLTRLAKRYDNLRCNSSFLNGC